MKKFLFILIIFLFISQITLQAQESVNEAENVSETAEELNPDKEVKSKTEVFNLGKIVVTDKKISKKASIEESSTTTILTAADIEAHSDKDLSDTFQSSPGITTYQHGKGHIRFKMRGYDMPYVALLMDGIPISDVYEANVDISKIPVMNASEIIINRGVSSALYGTTGTVGSINIVTKKPVDLFANASAEYGLNGDYNLNMSHGNTLSDFYYWLTATASKQAPYEVSEKLTKSERRKWLNKFCPDNLGYTVNDTSSAAVTYLNDTGEWPHQEVKKYNISGKTGYTFNNVLETGITASYSSADVKRYSLSVSNTEGYDVENNEWDGTDKFSVSAYVSTWDVYNVQVAPYINYELNDFSVKANVFFISNYEVLDAYGDIQETTAFKWWAGVHSNWQNTSAGFNIFPSYLISSWNKLNSSILFRWDKHLERDQADEEFVDTGEGSADYAYDAAGYDWIDTKEVTGKQITIALEDEIDLSVINIPAGINVGVSYDAQKLDKFKSMGRSGWYREYTTMEDQYIADSDSMIWGTRDSINPVTGVTCEPFKDFLVLRSSYSQKTKLPTMSQYSNVSEDTDSGLKPEKSYNTNIGFELFFLDKSVNVRTDYFYSRFKDKLATLYDETEGLKYYMNIEGEERQGIELISGFRFDKVAGIMDLNIYLSYVYLQANNLDSDTKDTDIYKGDTIAGTPEHQFVADIRMNFITDTAVNIYGDYTANAVQYVMSSNPDTTDAYSIDYYKTIKLHNPLMFNIKISQKFMNHYEVYAFCKNIFDDYAADPFNPGPGRQFYFGAKAEL
ncbi:MAG: TonB-dependent receptor plug domain-containing protein [Spirochaetes bacterium]|nr:TonB-dependent receptor plug domain-containing protein [Spirochaetota bacterium]